MRTQRSASTKAVAALTAGAFLFAACSSEAPVPEEAPDQFTVEMSVHTATPEGGFEQRSLGVNTLTVADYEGLRRPLQIGDQRTDDPLALMQATVITVPLKSGGEMQLRRTGDVLELEGLSDGVVSRSVTQKSAGAIRLTADGLELYQEGAALDGQPAMSVGLRGLEQHTQLRQAFAAALAINILAASFEDVEHFDPATWTVIAVVVGILGAAWLVFCGVTLNHCMDKCKNREGFKVGCGGAKITVNDDIKVSFSADLACKCTN